MMTSNQRTAAAFLGAAALTGAIAATYMFAAGLADESIRVALRISGRAAFVVLLAAFVARPLRQLLKAPWTAALLRNRRLVGVAFAGIHSAHLGIILLRVSQQADFELSFADNHLGMAVYTVIYAMLITSFDGPARAVGKKPWKVLHKLGLFYLFAAFLQSQLPRSLDQLELANGVLIALAVVALVIRLTAFLGNRRPKPQPQ